MVQENVWKGSNGKCRKVLKYVAPQTHILITKILVCVDGSLRGPFKMSSALSALLEFQISHCEGKQTTKINRNTKKHKHTHTRTHEKLRGSWAKKYIRSFQDSFCFLVSVKNNTSHEVVL
jgi:hypothetical protein